MYNNIPSERTSKRTIFIVLLCCIALLSVLAAGYFAWIAKDVQTRLDQIESMQNAHEPVPQEVVEEAPVPVFAYPEAIQAPRRTEATENRTLLMSMLEDWGELNARSVYCANVGAYVTSAENYSATGGVSVSARTTARELLTDEGVRAALLSYFTVSPQHEQAFFDGIDQAIDEDDRFSENFTMCASGSRKFLLLDDVHEVPTSEGYYRLASFPEVLEWTEQSSLGLSWTIYPVGEYQITDGYQFIPDWYGNVLVHTGYGDAGYVNWEILLLEVSAGVPSATLIEKCLIEPMDEQLTDTYESVLTCEVEYTE